MPTRRTVLTSIAALSLAGCDGKSTPSTGSRPGTDGGPGPDDTGTPDPSTTDTGTGPGTDTAPIAPGPEPAEVWNPSGAIDEELFLCGVQTGDALPDAVVVAVRQFELGIIDLAIAVGTDEGWSELPRIEGLQAEDGVVIVEIDGLLPDHAYSLVAYAPDGVRRSSASRFRTALDPRASRVLRIGATSCLGSPGAPWASMTRVAQRKLDVFLLLGDTIYADEGLRPAGDWEGHWTDALATAGLRNLTASTSVIATWDDHEVDNNFLVWEQPDDAAAGLEAFVRGIPQRRGPGGGLWRKLSWGTVLDVFVLDCRGERTPDAYLSEAQFAWLEQELAASTARFKLVMNSVPITDMDDVLFGVANSDGWVEYPDDRARILDFVADQGITGVLWLSGDVHWGSIATVDPPGGPHADRIEVICGPAGSLINPVHLVANDEDHYVAVVGQYNCVVLELDPDTGTVDVTFEGDTGPITTRRTTL